jgi:transcriptional regulator with XRE-family HTH domain
MPANPKEPGTPTVTQAVRQLRIKLGDTQQEFAQRLGLAISTVVRYESTRPPRPGVLKRYYALAVENNLYDVAAMFQEAIVGQVAIAPSLLKLGALASHTIPGAHADLAVLLNHLEYGSGTAEEKIIEAISRLKRVLPEIEKLNLYLPKPAPETLQKDLSISGQGTVRRDVLHLPGGGTRLIEVTVTDGSPPAASEEPQGTAEGEERSAPK